MVIEEEVKEQYSNVLSEKDKNLQLTYFEYLFSL